MLANGDGPKESMKELGANKSYFNSWSPESTSITNLESPLEDCDFSMETREENISICKQMFEDTILYL